MYVLYSNRCLLAVSYHYDPGNEYQNQKLSWRCTEDVLPLANDKSIDDVPTRSEAFYNIDLQTVANMFGTDTQLQATPALLLS